MAERQELQLQVTLVDQASAGLDRIRRELGDLTGPSTKAQLDAFGISQSKLGEQIKQVTELAIGGQRAWERYVRQLGAAGATIAGMTATIAVGVNSLKKFSEHVVDLSNKARVMGIPGAELKSLIQQYEKFGVSAQTVEQSMAGFSAAVAEMGRVGSERRHRLIELAGAYGVSMQRGIDKILATQSAIGKVREVVRQAHEVFNNRMRETNGNVVDATNLMNDYLKAWDIDPLLAVGDALKDITNDDNERWKERQKRAEEFNRTSVQLHQETVKFINDIKFSFLASNGVVVLGLKEAKDLIIELHELWNKAQSGAQTTGQKAATIGAKSVARAIPGVGQALTIWDILQMRIPGAGTSTTVPTAPAVPIPGLQHGGIVTKPTLAMVGERGSEAVIPLDQGAGSENPLTKALEENTAEQKKLNNNFILLDRGEAELKGLSKLVGFLHGGGGGGASGSYGPSGGTTPGGGSRPTASTAKSAKDHMSSSSGKSRSQANEQPNAAATTADAAQTPSGDVKMASSLAGSVGTFEGGAPKGLIIHYTGGVIKSGEVYAKAASGGDAYMTKYHAQLFMDTDGNITRIVPYGQKTWHAGPANETDEGMEISTAAGGHNPNLKESPLNPKQMTALKKYYTDARAGGMYPAGVRGHSEAMPPPHRENEGEIEARILRKMDTGPGTGKGAGKSNPLGIGGGHDDPPLGATSDPHAYHTGGKVTIGGKSYDWASGGAGRGSIPFGMFGLDFSSEGVGKIGMGMAKHGFVDRAIAGLSDVGKGNVLADPKYPKDPRTGVEVHPGKTDVLEQLNTLGCFGVPPSQWPAFKETLKSTAASTPDGKLGLQIMPGKDPMSSSAYIGPLAHFSTEQTFAHDRSTIDATSTRSATNIDTSGKLTANVTAPHGTKVSVEGGGLFDKTEMNRSNAMVAAP